MGGIATRPGCAARRRRAALVWLLPPARGRPCGVTSRAGPGEVRGAAPDRRRDRADRAPRRRRHGRRCPCGADGPRAQLVRDRADPRTGSPDYVAALGPLPAAPSEDAVYAALGVPWCPPELREAPFRGEPPPLIEIEQIRGDLHCHTTWSDGRASVAEMARAARARGYEYLAICDHTPAVGAVQGSRRRRPPPGRGNRSGQRELAPFRVLRGIECDILPDGRLDLPDDVLAELDWVQASVHGGQRMPRADDQAGGGGSAPPRRRCLSHPTGRIINRRPENALDLERIFDVARDAGSRAGGQRPARTGWTSAASTCAMRCVPASRSSAPPTRTPRRAWTTSRSRSRPRAAGGRRPPTSSTPARWRHSSLRAHDRHGRSVIRIGVRDSAAASGVLRGDLLAVNVAPWGSVMTVILTQENRTARPRSGHRAPRPGWRSRRHRRPRTSRSSAGRPRAGHPGSD